MTYAPINTSAYSDAFAGAIAGMNVSGWIVASSATSYSKGAAIAGTFAQAFDQVWNNAAPLNIYEQQAILSACANDFRDRQPGDLNNPTFLSVSNWQQAAAACIALVLSGDLFLASQGIVPPSGVSPIGPAGGNLAGNYPNPTVAAINNATVPAAGALTVGNALQVTGVSALGYAPINLAGGANFVAGILPAGNQAPQALAGDVTGTTGANTLSGQVTPSILQWVANTAPTLQEATQTADIPTNNFTIAPQISFAGATGTNRNGGKFVVNLPIPVGAGAESWLEIDRGGISHIFLGPYPGFGTTIDAVWMLPGGAAPSQTNYIFGSSANLAFMNAPAGGSFQMRVGNAIFMSLSNTTALWTVNAQPTADNTYGLGAVGGNSWSTIAAYKHEFTNTADPATPAVGGVLYGKTGNLRGIDTLGTLFDITPQPGGAINTQVGQQTAFVKYTRLVATGTTVTQVIALPTNTTNVQIQVESLVKIAVAGSVNAAGDTFSDLKRATFKNVGGVVTQVGASVDVALNTDASLNTSTVTFAIAGTNITVTLTVNATAGTLGTADCTLGVQTLFN